MIKQERKKYFLCFIFYLYIPILTVLILLILGLIFNFSFSPNKYFDLLIWWLLAGYQLIFTIFCYFKTKEYQKKILK